MGQGSAHQKLLSVIKASLGWPAQRRLCTLMNINGYCYYGGCGYNYDITPSVCCPGRREEVKD